MDTTKRGGMVEGEKAPTIALRINDRALYNKLIELSKDQHMSINMAVNMLLGFAFNEVERQNKRFVPKVIFESE